MVRAAPPSIVGGLLALTVSAANVGCGGSTRIVRVLSGELEVGPVIASDAYAAFLDGALAEEDGKLGASAAFYELATKYDRQAAETWARLGTVRCRAGAIDGGLDAAARASAIDRENASAAFARSLCDRARGPTAQSGGEDALAMATRLEPRDPEFVRELAARDVREGHPERARVRIEGWLLEPHADPSLRMAAAEILFHQGRAQQAVEMAKGAVLLSSLHARAAARIAGDMALSAPREARNLAAAIVDAAPLGADGHGSVATTLGGEPLVFLLAVDDAILRRDADLAVARATKGSVLLGDVFGRAMLLGVPTVARAVLPLLDAGAPRDAKVARLILGEALQSADRNSVAFSTDRVAPDIGHGMQSPELPLALGAALASRAQMTLDAEAARELTERLPLGTPDARDTLLVNAFERSRAPIRTP